MIINCKLKRCTCPQVSDYSFHSIVVIIKQHFNDFISISLFHLAVSGSHTPKHPQDLIIHIINATIYKFSSCTRDIVSFCGLHCFI